MIRQSLIATLAIALIAVIFGQISVVSSTPEQVQAPTRVPPTPIPRTVTGETEVLPERSAVARIAENGIVNVGILYNEPPFGQLNIRGAVSGFDADLANSLASTWGVDTNFIQVTRQSERLQDMLEAGQVDMIIASLVNSRDLSERVEFSQSYYIGGQSLMLLADDPAINLSDMANRRIGVVIASPSERALQAWSQRSGTAVQIETYLTLDRAYVALAAGEVDGIVDSSHHLDRVSAQQPDLTRILEEPVEQEPYAVAFLRQDVHMRDLINRTLQYLRRSGRIREVTLVHFTGESNEATSVWRNLPEEAPSPSQYPAELVYPSQYVLPRIQNTGVVRVAGLFGSVPGTGAPESEVRLDTLHRQILDTMASRWGVRVEYIASATGEQALQLVESGQADIAVGVEPDWNWGSRVDFLNPYLLHGERLMVLPNDGNVRFTDLGGGSTIITPINEATAVDRVVEIAVSVNSLVEVSQQREQDLAFAFLADESVEASAVFGDSLKLIPHVQSNPDALSLTMSDDDTTGYWYSESYINADGFAPREMVMAVPRNDVDFRLLVQHTLQDIIREGLLQSWLAPVMMPEDMPSFEVWPGETVTTLSP